MPTPSGLTPQYGFPYLLETDVPDVATASQLFAQAVESVLKNQRIGTVEICLTVTAPTGAVLLQGQAVTRTGKYAALFAKWGTKFGSGNGSTTFNLPDFRGKGPVGYKSGTPTFGTLGASVGSATITLTTSNIPRFATVSLSIAPHTHTGTTGNESTQHNHDTPTDTAVETPGSTLHVVTSAGTGISFGQQITSAENTTHHHAFTTNATTATGTVSFGQTSPTAISTVQPSLVVNFIAWYE